MFGVKNDSKTVEDLYIFKISDAKRHSEKRNNSFKKVGFYILRITLIFCFVCKLATL